MATIEVNEENFESTAMEGIVLLDFWAEWCAPCRAFGPIFGASAERHPDIKFGKINTEQQAGLAREFGIRSIPTLMVLRDGILLLNQPGMLPGAVLEELIEKVRALDMDEVRRSIDADRGEAAAATAAER